MLRCRKNKRNLVSYIAGNALRNSSSCSHPREQNIYIIALQCDIGCHFYAVKYDATIMQDPIRMCQVLLQLLCGTINTFFLESFVKFTLCKITYLHTLNRSAFL